MASFKRFGTLSIFLAYLLFQFNNINAEGLTEAQIQELEDIKRYLKEHASGLKPQLTTVGAAEKVGGLKDRVNEGARRAKSEIRNMWGRLVHSKSKVGEDLKSENEHGPIFPGTLWCGGGTKAKSYNELGYFNTTDACCRAHDMCPLNILAGKSLGPLKNNGYFTRSWCACDETFYSCLKNENKLIAREVGNFYFSLLKPQCIDYNYPAKCVKYSSIMHIKDRKCIEYKYDTTEDKILQWKDTPDYVEAFNDK